MKIGFKKISSAVFGCLLSFVPFLSAFADALDGKVLFQQKMCATCHGKEGQGGSVGPSLKNLGKGKEELVAFLKKGSAKMRPVKATDEELSALADYLLSLK